MQNELTCEEVAVTAICCGESILMVYNPKWGAFTLPMTKVRRWQYGRSPKLARIEHWADAAMRNVGECLGMTSVEKPKLFLDIHDLRQSDRDAQSKHYHFQVYGFGVEQQTIVPGIVCQWLNADEILDERRRPISPTAQTLVQRLDAEAKLRGLAFPPPLHPAGAQRQSVSGLALFQKEEGGKTLWLSQWNNNWNCYFFVGGHKRNEETFRECVIREVGEELKLTQGTHFEVDQVPRPPLHYEEWSAGAWQQTEYRIELFDCRLIGDAERLVAGNPANRWLSEAEIEAERTALNKPVSYTMGLIVKLAGLF